MKHRFIQRVLGGTLAALLACGLALPAFADCGETRYAYAQQSGCIRYQLPLNVAGAAVQNWQNLNVTGIADAKGQPVIATLSTDGHFYVVPTSTGYLYIGTGY